MTARAGTWRVVDDRGRVVSRHATEASAWAAIDRRERRQARMSNRPGMQGGGYARISHAVLPPCHAAAAAIAERPR